jgi:hypothetical protein
MKKNGVAAADPSAFVFVLFLRHGPGTGTWTSTGPRV